MKKDYSEKVMEILKRKEMYSVPIDPVALANTENIVVRNAVFYSDDISGMIAKRSGKTLILVNINDSVYRKRFTISHELGHYFLHMQENEQLEFIDYDIDFFRGYSPETSNQNKIIEYEANTFAAELLMPTQLITERYQKIKNLKKLSELFMVSEIACGIRINELGL